MVQFRYTVALYFHLESTEPVVEFIDATEKLGTTCIAVHLSDVIVQH